MRFRLDREVRFQLDELAREMERSRSYVTGNAVRDFVEREYTHLTEIVRPT